MDPRPHLGRTPLGMFFLLLLYDILVAYKRLLLQGNINCKKKILMRWDSVTQLQSCGGLKFGELLVPKFGELLAWNKA